MKILQVVCYFYPAWAYGGVPRNVYGLCQELVKRGHDITVFTTDAYNSRQRTDKPYEIVDGIEILRFHNISNSLAYHHRLFFPQGMSGKMNKALNHYDVVHLNDYRTVPNLLAHHYAHKYNKPYILQARGSLPNTGAKQALKYIYDSFGGHNLLHDASRLIAVSPLEVEQYTKEGITPYKIDTIPNGIDINQFKNLPLFGEFRDKHRIPADSPVVLYLGRLHQRKGIDLLIDSFAEVIKELPKSRLVIAGEDDGCLPELQKQFYNLKLVNKVLFVGGLYDRDKLSAFVDSDVFVLPAVNEIFGISIMEALACGTPAIIADSCGIADVINNKAGLAVPYDIKSFTNAMLKLLSDTKLRKQFSQNGLKLIRDNYNWGKIALQMESVYKKVVKADKINA